MVCLDPGLLGLAVGSGVDYKIKAAAGFLGVPAVVGLGNLDQIGPRLRRVRLDGTNGTLEEVPEDPRVAGR